MINVDPLVAGGVPPSHVVEQLQPYMKGYPLCLYCPGDVHRVKKPDIAKLVEEELPSFMGADVVRLVHGAREGAFLALFALYKHHVKERKDKAPFVILDGNTHYSMVLAVERSMLTPVLTEVEESQYRVVPEDFARKIEEIEDSHSKEPLAVIVNYPDGKYGNLPELKRIAKIAKEHNVYVIVDGAYSIGRMPFNMKSFDVDVAIASAHKSMACIGPLGVVGMEESVGRIVTKESEYREGKEVELLGCSARGLPTVCLFFVMPHLKKRVGEWEEKVKLANYFVERAERELGFELRGEKPHRHDLLNFDTSVLYEKFQKEGKDRFFLYRYLKKEGIIGVKPGITKTVKLSTYLLNKEEADFVIETFSKLLA